jgi:hypothetical protein
LAVETKVTDMRRAKVYREHDGHGFLGRVRCIEERRDRMDLSDKYCPGAIRLRQPQPEYIHCCACGSEMEIWSDEAKATCHNCGKVNSRQASPACVDWCQEAEKCLGTELYNRIKATRTGA